MAKINADGNKLIECGEEIENLVNKYNKIIENLFIKIEKIPMTCWSGESSDTYVANLLKEKYKYIDFGKQLKLYGKAVKNSGNNINYIIKKWDDK